MEPSAAPAPEAHNRLLDENRQLRARVAELEKRAVNQTGLAAPAHEAVVHRPRLDDDALLQSEARFRRLMEVSSQIVWITDAHGVPTEDSPSWRAFTGRSYDQWAGWKWLEGIHPEDRPRVEAAWRHAVATQGPYRIEFRQIHHSGEYRHISCQAAPVLNGDGSVREWVGMNVDITDRKRAEEALRESEDRLRFAMATSRTGAWDLDLSTWTARTSLEHDLILGYPQKRDGWTYAAFLEHVLPEDRAAVDSGLRAAIAARSAWSTECRIRRTDGQVRWIWGAGRYREDAAGRNCRFAGVIQDITERKEAEEALRKSEARYRTLFESIDEGFCIIEVILDGERPVDYRFLEINPAFEQHVGIRGAVGRTVRELVPKIEEFWVQTYGRVALTGEPTRCARYAASLRQWFDVYAFRVGEPREHKVAVLVSNITPRKENEAALCESESRYRALADLCPDAIFITLENRFAYANEAAAKLLGAADPQEVVGLSPFDRIEPRYHDLVRARMRKVLEEGCTVPLVDYVWRRLDGAPVNVEVAGGPITWQGKRAIQIVVRDVSERKAAEELLRRERDLLDTVMNGARNVHLVYLDRDFNFLRVNEAYAAGCGFRPDEMIGKNHFALYPHAENEAIFARVRDTGEAFEIQDKPFEFPDQPQRGVTYWDWTLLPVKDSTGRVEGLVFSLHETTSRKRVEAELEAARRTAEQARAAAEAANAAKDHFLAVLSHELRTPLAPVLMTASALEHDSSVPEWLREDMSLIRRSVDLEVRLIDDLLDLNRIARGKLELRKQRVGAHEKILAALEICRFDASQNGLILEMNLGAERHQVIADPGRLQQVIWNLLKNAIKFTPRGGHVTVRSSNPDPDTLRIEVCDTGMGIAPDLMPHLFDAFEQGGQHVTRQFGGMGLGLAISKALTEMQGGRISAFSEGPGKGALFALDFRLAAAPVEPGRDAERRGSPAARRLRVLLVEDHGPTSHAVDRLLTKAGHEVRAAGSVREALQIAESYPFDILLSDLGLPDGSGLDVLRELRKQNPQVKAIAMSGFGMEHDLQRSRAAGFAEHLIKPVEFKALEGALIRVAG